MAKLTGSNISVSVNSVDLSDHVRSVSINSERDIVDVTGMGASNKEYLASTGDASIEVEFLNDYAASSVDATLWPLHANKTVFAMTVKPVSATTSTTNPAYSMTAILPNYNPIAGGIGEALTTTVTFQNSHQSGITRATT